jgi:simple sugar transport system ATP-binding protein
MLVDALTVWENLWLVHPERPRLRLDRAGARRRLRDVSERFSLDLDPDAVVAGLPVGTRQRLEIAKALVHDVSLLILDEPTAVLAPAEIEDLFRVLRTLRESGTTVLFISHKLDEVLRIADRITVLQRGRVTARCAAAEADVPSLRRSIVGSSDGEPDRSPVPRAARPSDMMAGGVRLAVQEISSRRAGRVPVAEVSFELRAGEILGVTGVDGNGQEELVALLAGVAPVDRGRILVGGWDATRRPVAERWSHGLSVLPGDRSRDGLVGDATVWENLAMREFGAPWARGRFLVDPARHRERAERLIERHAIRGPGPDAPARNLSGGNQQKLLLARELAADPRTVVLLNPTRGLDVGAADALLRELSRLRDEGRAVLLVSTELDEVLRHSDRIAVMWRGRWRDAPAHADRDAVGALMLSEEAS